MFKKKIGIYALTFAMAAMGMTGCSSDTSSSSRTEATTQAANKASSEPFSVVCTIFPEYDWVKEILGDHADNAELTYLLDNGVDLHSYQPTADDMMKISTCDLFIYVGGESDEWVDSVLNNAQNKDMLALDLMELLGDKAKEETAVEGMETEEHEEEEDEKEYDEHIWLSLKNASFLCQKIADKLSEKDPDNKDTYAKNAKAYIEKLNKLDTEYEQTCSSAKNDTLIFADRFPFRYMTDDYGLDYYAAFVGCSAETEASFETISFLANKVDELNLHAIMTIEGDNHKIAQTIADTATASDIEILTMDSMQSVTSKDVDAGATYLKIMEDNLAVLDKALK